MYSGVGGRPEHIRSTFHNHYYSMGETVGRS